MSAETSCLMNRPYKYFSEEEFNSATPSCSLLQMDDGFMKTLDLVRARAGVPMKVNSGYRSTAWERAHGRTGNSYHCVGQAVDIHCVSSTARHKIVEACMFYGLDGLGIAKTFIHIDNRRVPKIFLYE